LPADSSQSTTNNLNPVSDLNNLIYQKYFWFDYFIDHFIIQA